MRITLVFIFAFILLFNSGCRTTVMPSRTFICPDLEKFFPINKSNFDNYLNSAEYDTLYVDPTHSDMTAVAVKIVNGTRIELMTTPKYNRVALLQKNLENNLSRRYDIDADTVRFYTDTWVRDNKGFRIGNSYTAIDGFVDHEKGYEICWKEALEIGELNLKKYTRQKGYQKILVHRNEPYLEPLWIFTVMYENGEQKYFTVDGVTGKFKRSSFFKVYPDAVKGVKQRRKL